MGWNNFSWSYTKWEKNEKCPLAYDLNYNKKDPRFAFVPNIHTERGNKWHKIAENFTLGKISGMPKELEKFAYEFRHIQKLKANAEEEWVVTREWERTHWKDWTGAWCRSKTDFNFFDEYAGIIYVGDHKTGKVYDSHRDQGHLYGTKALHFHPEAKTAVVEMWYLDSGEVGGPMEFKRSELASMSKLWERRARKLEVKQVFEPKKNMGCKSCPIFQTKECSATYEG